MVMGQILVDCISCCSLAKENQSAETFGFQRTKEPLQVSIHVWAAWRQSDRFDSFVAQKRSKRFAELGVTIHDQVVLAVEKTVLVIGQLAGDLFHPCFVGTGRATCEMDATRLEFHHEEKIERGQATAGPDFHGGKVDRGQYVPV